jgi:hypothetical protein
MSALSGDFAEPDLAEGLLTSEHCQETAPIDETRPQTPPHPRYSLRLDCLPNNVHWSLELLRCVIGLSYL